mgnify:CR=1 FL=1
MVRISEFRHATHAKIDVRDIFDAISQSCQSSVHNKTQDETLLIRENENEVFQGIKLRSGCTVNEELFVL